MSGPPSSLFEGSQKRTEEKIDNAFILSPLESKSWARETLLLRSKRSAKERRADKEGTALLHKRTHVKGGTERALAPHYLRPGTKKNRAIFKSVACL